MNIKIIPGKKQDLPLLLEMIKELAEFEKSPELVKNKIEWMERDGFGEGKIFDFYMAWKNGQTAGMALTYFRYSTWRGKTLYLEDLYVKPDFRGLGLGNRLMNFLSKKALEQGCNRLAWEVLDWNKGAIDFYEKLGASFDSEWINCAIEGKELKALAKNA